MSWADEGWKDAARAYGAEISNKRRRAPKPNIVVPFPTAGDAAATPTVSVSDFHAYMPMHSYIYEPTREMWPAGSVNARIAPIQEPNEEKPTPANQWLDRNRPVEQMTWSPGDPTLIENRLVSDGGWIERPGARIFNLYRPPTIKDGNPALAVKWIEHIRRVYGDDTEHLVNWFACRVQRPELKINHGIVLGGNQGIGKDTLLEPVKRAVGPWNFSEVSPKQMLGRFNGFVKSVVLRVSEARDLGDVDRFAFYDHTKVYTAAPPDVLRVDEKHLREHSVLNCTGLIITTNHKADGIYLPADDRRHYVAWSDLSREDFTREYWNDLWGWYDRGGDSHVASYLRSLELTDFDPKAPPLKTRAFWDIVAANHAPESGDLADALELLGNPSVVTIDRVMSVATPEFGEYLGDRKNRRQVPHRFEEADYVPIRNSDAKDGLWKIRGRRCSVYAKRELSLRDQIKAAAALT